MTFLANDKLGWVVEIQVQIQHVWLVQTEGLQPFLKSALFLLKCYFEGQKSTYISFF